MATEAAPVAEGVAEEALSVGREAVPGEGVAEAPQVCQQAVPPLGYPARVEAEKGVATAVCPQGEGTAAAMETGVQTAVASAMEAAAVVHEVCLSTSLGSHLAPGHSQDMHAVPMGSRAQGTCMKSVR